MVSMSMLNKSIEGRWRNAFMSWNNILYRQKRHICLFTSSIGLSYASFNSSHIIFADSGPISAIRALIKSANSSSSKKFSRFDWNVKIHLKLIMKKGFWIMKKKRYKDKQDKISRVANLCWASIFSCNCS